MNNQNYQDYKYNQNDEKIIKKDYGIRVIIIIFILAIGFLVYQKYFVENQNDSENKKISENIIDVGTSSGNVFSGENKEFLGKKLGEDENLSGENQDNTPKNDLTGDIMAVRKNYDKIKNISTKSDDNNVASEKNNFGTGEHSSGDKITLQKETSSTLDSTKKGSANEDTSKLDLETDNSYTKYVGKNHPFNDVKYAPKDLQKIYSTKTLKIINDKGLGYQQLRKIATQNIQKMAEDFYKYFKKPLVIYSSYRSYDYQKGIDQNCKASGRCAKEGESEHQLGLALDLREASNKDKFLKNYKKEYEWLKNNAHKYGFTQSYQKGVIIDGYHEEPWHWRYLGIPLATKLKNLNITFSQYYKEITK